MWQRTSENVREVSNSSSLRTKYTLPLVQYHIIHPIIPIQYASLNMDVTGQRSKVSDRTVPRWGGGGGQCQRHYRWTEHIQIMCTSFTRTMLVIVEKRRKIKKSKEKKRLTEMKEGRAGEEWEKERVIEGRARRREDSAGRKEGQKAEKATEQGETDKRGQRKQMKRRKEEPKRREGPRKERRE